MKQLRVLHVVASLAPRHGGPTEAALQMVRALRSEEIDASILSSDDDGGGSLNVPLRRWVDYEGVPVQFLPRVKSKQHSLVGFTLTPEFDPWLKCHACDYDFIHVHTVFSFPANVAMRTARRLRVPYAVRPLGQLCRWSMRQRSLLKKLQLAVITRRNIDGAAFVHVTSRMEADETAEWSFRSPCRVIPHGIKLPPLVNNARNDLRIELGIDRERRVVVFMSRLHEKKGVELLLQACADAGDAAFDLVLAGSGDESYVETLKSRAFALGLYGRIHWVGFVSGEQKWRLLQGCDLFVLPSYSENFAIAVLEALACGLPVVVSDQVALADMIAKDSLGCVVPLSVECLANAIRHLLSAPEKCDEIRRRAIHTATTSFNWATAARQLIEAYQTSVFHSVNAK